VATDVGRDELRLKTCLKALADIKRVVVETPEWEPIDPELVKRICETAMENG
jgi:hypothetical protein